MSVLALSTAFARQTPGIVCAALAASLTACPASSTVDGGDAFASDHGDALSENDASGDVGSSGDTGITDPVVDHSNLADSLAADGRGVHVRVLDVPAGRDARFVVATRDSHIVDIDVDAVSGARATFRGVTQSTRAWFRPSVWAFATEPDRQVDVLLPRGGTATQRVTLRMRSYGVPVVAVQRERSLAWTDSGLLDDASAVGLGRVMRAASMDGHGGRLFEALMRRFGTTAHSERAGPVQFIDEIATTQGRDPTRWNFDVMPFLVTGVHNRIDLARGADCGEFRVSIASRHATYHPFHLIFLFQQPPAPEDVSSSGIVHCTATAQAWAELSGVDAVTFATQARAMLDAALVHARFLLAESVEFTISPWEWRQWRLGPNPDAAMRDVLPEVFDNIPLFQTVDIEGLNAPSARRVRFLDWVATNADALDVRQIEVPEEFRSPSARVTQGVPRTALDLTGIPDSVRTRWPQLRQHIEIVGCPTCHSVDAPFVQTLPDRTFSPFYTKELLARARHLLDRTHGAEVRTPFGPLQADPVLPP